MNDVTVWLSVGIMITFAAMVGVGVYTVRKIKSSEDFTIAGKKASPIMVAGTIVGSCVGSGGTVGTAQTAFKMGLVGWWQTLGLSIGCLILGVGLAQYIYKTQVETGPQLLEKKYGPAVRPVTAVFSSVAIFLSILSQTKGFLPLLTSMIPMPIELAAAICVVLVLLFVLFGGIFATSLGGLVKIFLILGSLIISGIIATVAMGGFRGFGQAFEFNPWLNLFSRGVGKDLAIGLGFVLGVLVTQVYIQAVLSARDAKAARDGAILAAIFTCPVGLFGVAVGLYMKRFFPEIDASQAFPMFMIKTFPPVIAGVFIGGLMLAALGSNAGLAFGVSTMLSRDLYKKIRKSAGDREMLNVLRALLIVVVALSGVFAVTKAGELIQTFIFLSYGMRTCVFLVPMLFALFYKGKLTRAAGMASVLAGPIVNIYWNLAKPTPMDPIYPGLLASFLAFVIVNAIAGPGAAEESGLSRDASI
jgi:SSS family solute:Na+ symporter